MKPNILFAFADDWGRYASCYTQHQERPNLNEIIQTPNFDRIAQEGALFLNALVPAPSCTPCRSSILSGQYFWQTGLGAILMGAIWDQDIPTWPLELERWGNYFIGQTYKVWSPGKSANAPMGGLRTNFESAGRDFNQFSHWVTRHMPTLGLSAAKDVLFNETRTNFQTFLDARPADQPFLYWWGPTNTHRTWERGSGATLWGLDPAQIRGRLPHFIPDVPEVREDAADYLGECLAVDQGLGVLIKELESHGEIDNTIIIVSGDHGIPGMPRAKCNLYDIGCEVALAIRWPETVQPGRIVNDFINLMDLAPTLCQIGEIDIPETMTGKSILPLLCSSASGQIDPTRDFVITGRERHVAHARDGYLPYPQRAIRENDFLYIINFEPDRWPMGNPEGLDDPNHPAPAYGDLAYQTSIAYPDLDASPTKAWMIHHRDEDDVEPLYQLAFGKRPREEMYDIKNDPDYLHNIANDPTYEKTRARLEKRLLQALQEQNDPRLMEQPCRYEAEPYAGPLNEAYLSQLQQKYIPKPR